MQIYRRYKLHFSLVQQTVIVVIITILLKCKTTIKNI